MSEARERLRQNARDLRTRIRAAGPGPEAEFTFLVATLGRLADDMDDAARLAALRDAETEEGEDE